MIPSPMVLVITGPVVLGTPEGVLDFSRGSAFDVVSTLLFLLLLGVLIFLWPAWFWVLWFSVCVI